MSVDMNKIVYTWLYLSISDWFLGKCSHKWPIWSKWVACQQITLLRK